MGEDYEDRREQAILDAAMQGRSTLDSQLGTLALVGVGWFGQAVSGSPSKSHLLAKIAIWFFSLAVICVKLSIDVSIRGHYEELRFPDGTNKGRRLMFFTGLLNNLALGLFVLGVLSSAVSFTYLETCREQREDNEGPCASSQARTSRSHNDTIAVPGSREAGATEGGACWPNISQ